MGGNRVHSKIRCIIDDCIVCSEELYVSILGIRNLFEKKWFQAVLVITGILVALGMVGSTLTAYFFHQNEPGNSKSAAFTVGGQEISFEQLDGVLKNQPTSSDPNSKLMAYGGAIDQLANTAAQLLIAKKYNVQLTDDMLRKYQNDSLEMQLMMIPFQLQQQKLLKPGASEAEIDAAFKKATGRTRAEIKKAANDETEAALKDAAKKEQLKMAYAGQANREAFLKKVTLTDEELKKTYDNFTMNHLAITKGGLSAEEKKAQAAKAKAELESGAKFADVYKKYTGTEAPAAPTEMLRSSMEMAPHLKSLLTLKSGQVSDVIDEFGSPAIYQVIKIESKLPKDFEKNKESLSGNVKQSKANEMMQKEIDAIAGPENIKWTRPFMKYVYQTYKQMSKPDATKDDWKALVDSCEKALDEESNDTLTMAYYVAFDNYFKKCSAAEQVDLKDKRIEVLEKVLTYTENFQLRMQIADLYFEAKRGEEGGAALEAAAENSAGYDAASEASMKEIENKVAAREKSNDITKDQADAIRATIKKWREDYEQIKKDEAEAKKAEQEAAKKLEEETKKEAEELKKKEEAEKKAEADKKATPAPTQPTAPAKK